MSTITTSGSLSGRPQFVFPPMNAVTGITKTWIAVVANTVNANRNAERGDPVSVIDPNREGSSSIPDPLLHMCR